MREWLTISATWAMGCVVFGGVGLSPTFTFDARYTQTGEDPVSQAEVSRLSPGFVFSTLDAVPDGDGDGLPDEWELTYFGSTTAAEPHVDSDGDGFDNLAEYNAGLNPRANDRFRSLATASFVYDARYAMGTDDYVAPNLTWWFSGQFALDTLLHVPDSDNDGLPDWWEMRYFGSATASAGPRDDPDGDGRVNLEEYNAGTDPTGADRPESQVAMSGDAFTFDARYSGLLPSVGTAFAVVRISDAFVCDTSGLYYDFDDDGLPEWWASTSLPSQLELARRRDVDGDGMSDYGEWITGTDFLDAQSRFSIRLVPVANASTPTYKLEWESLVGSSYSVWTTTNLSAGWTCVTTLEGTGDTLEYVAEDMAPMRFFKVSVSAE